MVTAPAVGDAEDGEDEEEGDRRGHHGPETAEVEGRSRPEVVVPPPAGDGIRPVEVLGMVQDAVDDDAHEERADDQQTVQHIQMVLQEIRRGPVRHVEDKEDGILGDDDEGDEEGPFDETLLLVVVGGRGAEEGSTRGGQPHHCHAQVEHEQPSISHADEAQEFRNCHQIDVVDPDVGDRGRHLETSCTILKGSKHGQIREEVDQDDGDVDEVAEEHGQVEPRPPRDSRGHGGHCELGTRIQEDRHQDIVPHLERTFK